MDIIWEELTSGLPDTRQLVRVLIRKFIPILRQGEWQNAAPSWISGKYYLDLRGDEYIETNYQDLLQTLHGQRLQAPPIGIIKEPH